MRRLEVIDGLRGYFLVFMFLNHLSFAGGYLLARVNFAELGFVQSAQGFVFLSGLLVGMIYTRRMERDGFALGAYLMWRRASELYAYTIASVIAILVLRQMLPYAPKLWDVWLGGIGDGGSAFRAAGAALLYQPTYLDILPQYVCYLLVAPPLVWLCLTGRWLWVAVGSAMLWLALQTGAHLPAVEAIDHGLARIDPNLMLRVAFNVLGWQLLFIGAMVIGALWARGDIDLERIFDPKRTLLVRAFAVSLVFFLAYRLGFTFEVVPETVMKRFQVYENRAEFGPIFLINFVLLGYVLAWLLIAGPRSQNRYVLTVSRVLSSLFAFPFLQLLGRHSLQIYAWHVVLVYLVLWLDGVAGPFGEISKTAIALFGVALLSAPAVYREWRGNRRARELVGRSPA